MFLAALGIRALKRNPYRSILTSLGIVIGVFSVVVLVSIALGAKELILQSIQNLGPNLLVVIPGSVTDSGAQVGGGTDTTLTVADAQAIRDECPDVWNASGALRTAAQVQSRHSNWSTVILGAEPSYLPVRDWHLAKGGFFGEGEEQSAARVSVLGRLVAQRLFGLENPIGHFITINHSPFRVIGILSSKGQSPMGMNQDDMVVIPLSTLQSQIMGVTYVGVILAAATHPNRVDAARREIEGLLRLRHHIPPDGRPDFEIQALSDIAKTANRMTLILTVLLALIASISLFVGGIGILNIMLVSVRERTREIGIRMAIGARPMDILLQFLTESAALSFFGSVTGGLLGILSILGIRQFLGWPAAIPWTGLALTISGATILGILFGLYPAYRASRLSPMEALRYE
ncbi:MAG: ABC transporter permease [Nitrospirota bacterium]|nr:ABC transporter permease [Nitrospirota bacterium]